MLNIFYPAKPFCLLIFLTISTYIVYTIDLVNRNYLRKRKKNYVDQHFRTKENLGLDFQKPTFLPKNLAK